MDTAKLEETSNPYDQHLESAGYNVVNIHPSLVEYDLMTDSWTELVSPEMSERMQSLHARVDFSDKQNHIHDVFPFKYFVNTCQGRAAEAFFWRTAYKKDKKVIQNLLFPTTRHHLVMNRMTPVEMPVEYVYDKKCDELFRGNLDCGKLRALLREEGGKTVAWVYIEAENNAAGGYPVSMSNVKEIKSILSDYGIPMVVDATRLMENAVMIQRFEPGYTDVSIKDIVREFCSYFDAMTCSLAKDFGIDRGGLIAVNDEKLHYRAKDTVATFGPGTNATDKAIVSAAFKDWGFVETHAHRRVDQAARLHAALSEHNLPVFSPASGHCVLVDVQDYLDTSKYQNAVTAFLAWIYAQCGVRGGMHVTGMTREYASTTLVRFAIPLCVPDSRIDALIEPFVLALKNAASATDLVKTSNKPGIAGLMYATYRPV